MKYGGGRKVCPFSIVPVKKAFVVLESLVCQGQQPNVKIDFFLEGDHVSS